MTAVAGTLPSLTGDPETAALLLGSVWRVGAGSTAVATLSYSFAACASRWPDCGSGSEPSTGFSPMAGSIEQEAARTAPLAWREPIPARRFSDCDARMKRH